ncbi:MAG: aminotransferase class IV [Paracoccaceae bacterium]|nr:MAG: aminotransferase class IV [Paracoccaceae bacterium]
MLWDGAAFPRIAGHMARLAGSARAFGWPCDRSAVAAALRDAVAPGVARRVRLTLGADGAVAVVATDLPASPAVWRLGLAEARLSSGDPWLAVKSTRRAAYDAARAALPAGCDEVAFLNERGEVCDGTITTVFFDLGRGLSTPPRASGLLPGVLRAGMLEAGQCHEAVLRAADLPVARLWLGNALRGLMPAVWAG